MRRSIAPKLIVVCSLALIMFQSCKDDSYLTRLPPVADQSFHEEFDTATAALSRGWKFINVSEPLGSSVWQNGGTIPPFFSAYSNNGSFAGFIGVDYLSTSAQQGIISNWVVSPLLIMQNDDKIIFYTRAKQLPDGSGDTTDFGNSLQLRLSVNSDSINVGTGLDAGDFSTLLFVINPLQISSSVLSPNPSAYPSQWTRFEAIISGLTGPVKGRFALRYFLKDGGSNGHGTGIAIDDASYKSVGY